MSKRKSRNALSSTQKRSKGSEFDHNTVRTFWQGSGDTQEVIHTPIGVSFFCMWTVVLFGYKWSQMVANGRKWSQMVSKDIELLVLLYLQAMYSHLLRTYSTLTPHKIWSTKTGTNPSHSPSQLHKLVCSPTTCNIYRYNIYSQLKAKLVFLHHFNL